MTHRFLRRGLKISFIPGHGSSDVPIRKALFRDKAGAMSYLIAMVTAGLVWPATEIITGTSGAALIPEGTFARSR